MFIFDKHTRDFSADKHRTINYKPGQFNVWIQIQAHDKLYMQKMCYHVNSLYIYYDSLIWVKSKQRPWMRSVRKVVLISFIFRRKLVLIHVI